MNFTLPTRLLTLAAATALLVLPATAQARATKDPAPKLTIDERVCKTGPADDQRFALVTATALLRSNADRVGLRFSVQEKNAKGKWVNLPYTDPTMGKWELSASGGKGLRYTQDVGGLAEGIQYRVVVQARGVDSSGRSTTATARRNVGCNQPQVTPRIVLTNSAVLFGTSSRLQLDVRNAGRSTSKKWTVKLLSSSTGDLLGELTGSPLKAKETARVTTDFPECKGRIQVVIQQVGDEEGAVRADQTTTISCSDGAQEARRKR